MKLICDIETFPKSEEELAPFMPPRVEFDPGAVKVGNLKDQAKIDTKIFQAEVEHEKAELDKRKEFIEKATLDARFSRVFAVGFCTKDGPEVLMEVPPDDASESQILTETWDRIYGYFAESVCGWNIGGFLLLREGKQMRLPVREMFRIPNSIQRIK